MLTKRKILHSAVLYQAAGYLLLLALIAADEILDVPHVLFGAPSTPVNLAELVSEAVIILVLGILSIAYSLRQIRRIRFLEGILPICSVCKKIRREDGWVSIEEYMNDHSEAMLSHGLCPRCAQGLLEE